ncbi:hypothetical protein NDA16_005009 [Ustilago loliicola]|nr:hypothetical protein NDA16_005009 [Ustilago loliicola]
MSFIAGPSAAPASDDDVQMLDSTGAVIPPSSSTIAAPIDVDAEGSVAGEGNDVSEDEYEIERIVSHSDGTVDGQLSYYVKWKGYPDSENSWVFESDMGGAQEMIQEYWAKVPKKVVKKMGAKGGKKGKRQSSIGVGSSTPSKSTVAGSAGKKRTRRESSLPNGEVVKRGRKGGDLAHSRSPSPDDVLIDIESDPALQRIRSDPTLTDDQKALLEQQHLHAIKLDRLRKRYARIPDWDPIVKKVEAVEKMSDNKLRVFVHFESGDRLAFESVVAHHRCPLKLLAFYEANLRFKRREDGQEDRVETLRGEEEQAELDEYNRAIAAGEEANRGANGDGQGGENGVERAAGLDRGEVGGAETEMRAEGEEVEREEVEGLGESQPAPEAESGEAGEEGEGGEGEGAVAAVAVAVTEGEGDGDGEGEGEDEGATTITTAVATEAEDGVTTLETATINATEQGGADESQ